MVKFFKSIGEIFTAFYSAPHVGHTSVNGQIKAGHSAHPLPRTEENPAEKESRFGQSSATGGLGIYKCCGGCTQHSQRPQGTNQGPQ